MLCVDGAMASKGVDTHSFLNDVDQQVEDISGSLFFNSRNAPEQLELLLKKCKERMVEFIKHRPVGMKEEMYTNKLTFALRDSIQESVQRRAGTPNAYFNVVETSFRTLFGYELKLPRGPRHRHRLRQSNLKYI